MTELFFIRHAEAEGNLYRKFHGHTEGKLTLKGKRQVELLKKRFENIHIDEVWSSDLERTRETARAVYEPKGLTLHLSQELRETNLGQWEDRYFGELAWKYPDEMDKFNNHPLDFVGFGAEGFVNTGNRLAYKVRELAEANDGKSLAIFSHGCALWAMMYILFGQETGNVNIAPHCDNTAVSRLIYENGVFTYDYLSDNSHLTLADSTLAHQTWWKGGTSDSDHNLRYVPLADNEGLQYVEFRKDAWQLIYGDLRHFDGSDYLLDARRTTEGYPEALSLCYCGADLAGVIQLHPTKLAEKSVGYIPFLYLREKYRNQGIGVQLIGYAVFYFRKLGRTKLQLRVAPTNTRAIHFYQKYGFTKIGTDSDLMGGSYIMEMEI